MEQTAQIGLHVGFFVGLSRADGDFLLFNFISFWLTQATICTYSGDMKFDLCDSFILSVRSIKLVILKTLNPG